MPPLNRSDLPPNPPSFNGQSGLLVLAYPMSEDHILWWARKHNIKHRLNSRFYTSYDRMGDAVLTMGMLIPEECKTGTVRFENGDKNFSWWFATNKEKDLMLASNLELINKVKKIIGAKDAPQWYELAYGTGDEY
jgi:hypothetical protein